MPLSHIEGIIWDLDGTLYRFSDAFEQACNIAAARTAEKLLPDLTFEDALKVAEESYNEWGFSGRHFVDRYGIHYPDYHFLYHDAIDETIIEKNDAMLAALQKLDLPSILVTHASRRWADRALTHLMMRDYFPHIIALEDTDFDGKAYTTAPFIKALELLNLTPEKVLVIEDSARNLIKPKEMGMTTAYIDHGKSAISGDSHIDFTFPDTLECLGMLMLAKEDGARYSVA